MSHSKEVAVGVALTLALSACTPSSPHETPPPSFSVSMPGEPTAEAPSFAPDRTATSLVGADAPLNLIYMPVTHRLPALFPNDITTKVRKGLRHNSTELRRDIKAEFEEATHGIYSPSSVTISRAATLALDTCMQDPNLDNGIQEPPIKKQAASLRKAGAINVIVVDQTPCDSKDSFGIAGFASNDSDPILNAGSFTTFAETVAHEVGHEAGLDHAGTLSCADAVTIDGCKTNETADPTSIMSYTSYPEPTTYSTVELAEMGLVGRTDIVANPKPGAYTLHDMTGAGTKIVEFVDDQTGEPVYITLEPDQQAAYDTTCLPDSKAKHIPESRILYATGATVSGKDINVTCFKTHLRKLTDSVQVRTQSTTNSDDRGDVSFLGLVLRPDRAPDMTGPELSTGEVRTGQVLFRSPTYSVVLKQIGKHAATIFISKV